MGEQHSINKAHTGAGYFDCLEENKETNIECVQTAAILIKIDGSILQPFSRTFPK